MARNKVQPDPIPEEFKNVEEAAEFWDTHSIADYWDTSKPVQFAVKLRHRRYLVALEPRLLKQVSDKAQEKGISTETLINIWITEKLKEG